MSRLCSGLQAAPALGRGSPEPKGLLLRAAAPAGGTLSEALLSVVVSPLTEDAGDVRCAAWGRSGGGRVLGASFSLRMRAGSVSR